MDWSYLTIVILSSVSKNSRVAAALKIDQEPPR
jgi:hypothetical protein